MAEMIAYQDSCVRVLPRLWGAAAPPGTEEYRVTTPLSFGLLEYDDGMWHILTARNRNRKRS